MGELLTQRVRDIVDALPQRSVIPDAVAERWIEGIVAFDPDRAIWHARRAGGIGGSEVGELLRRQLGMNEHFKTPEAISREKLLLDLPEGDNPYIRRGREGEILAERVYHRLTGRTSLKDSEPYAGIFGLSHAEHDFALGNPDDVNETDSGVIIPDFKVRSTLDWKAPVDLAYISQCHWYGSIYQSQAKHFDHAKPIDHYCLAELDIPNNMMDGFIERMNDAGSDPEQRLAMIERMSAQIAEWNIRGFGMRITAFDHDPQLAQDLVKAADQFWNDYVMQGTPYFEARQLEKPDEKTLDKARAIASELGDTRMMKKVVTERESELISEFNAIASEYDLGECQIDPQKHAPISISQTRRFDVEAAGNFLIAQGADRDALVKEGSQKLNPDRALKLLENNGIDASLAFDYSFDSNTVKASLKQFEDVTPKDFESPGCGSSLSRRKVHEPMIEAHRQRANELLSQFHSATEQQEPHPEDDDNTPSMGMA